MADHQRAASAAEQTSKTPDEPKSPATTEPKERASAEPKAAGFTWHETPQEAKLQGASVLVVAESAAVALVLRAEEWAMMESGTLPYTGIVAVRTQDLQR